MAIFIYGSSAIPKTNTSFSYGFTGPTGNTGNIGPTGPTGSGTTGATGNTGGNLLQIIKTIDGKLKFIFSDGTIVTTIDAIQGPTGNLYVKGEGYSLAAFNILGANETLGSFSDTETGLTSKVDIVNIKNIKTNSDPFITIEEGTGDDENTLIVYYDLVGLAFVDVTGDIGNLVKNNPGDIQVGATGTNYNPETKSLDTQISNVSNRMIRKSSYESTNTKIWYLDPYEANLFYLNGASASNGSWVFIKSPRDANSMYSFTIVSSPGMNTEKPVNFFYSPNNYSASPPSNLSQVSSVIWPYGYEPCFTGKHDVFNFTSIGGVWYGSLVRRGVNLDSRDKNFDYAEEQEKIFPVTYSSPTTYGVIYREVFDPSVLTSCQINTTLQFLSNNYGITSGACCNLDCSCSDTFNIQCNGYFLPGLTCTSGFTFCNTAGACCLQNGEGQVLSCQELSYCDCATIATNSNMSFVWNKFEGLKQSCDDFDCTKAFEGFGACCDGNGNCNQTRKENCNGYFQGIGVNCITSENRQVCSEGNGACCDSGITCNNGVTGENCLSQNNTYFGDSSNCNFSDCVPQNIPCYDVIPGETLKFGDLYADGIVVGIFNPNNSTCFGNPIFGSSGSSSTFEYLTTSGGETSCSNYTSRYDYVGYGFTGSEGLCDSSGDSYILVLSLEPICLDSNKNVVEFTNSELNKYEFVWSHGGNYWGPIFNSLNGNNAEFSSESLQYKEGYIYDYNDLNTKINLPYSSFIECGNVRITDSPKNWQARNPNISFNGKWFRNYGFMNTVRMLNSEYAYYYGKTGEYYTTSTFNIGITATEITSARAIALYNNSKPETNDQISDWYIPSYDELAFIAKHTLTSELQDNINIKLLQNGGMPLDGWHWSSTGTFTEGSNEYILNHPNGLTFGTSAWAIKFNADGIENSYLTKKANRTSNKYKVRPIKAIRCDGAYYTKSSSNNMFWRLIKFEEYLTDLE